MTEVRQNLDKGVEIFPLEGRKAGVCVHMDGKLLERLQYRERARFEDVGKGHFVRDETKY